MAIPGLLVRHLVRPGREALDDRLLQLPISDGWPPAVAWLGRDIDHRALRSLGRRRLAWVIESELKAGSSVILVAGAWFWAITSSPVLRSAATLIAIGMTLGCLGDASPLLGPLWPDPQRTLANMVLFGIGHTAYIGACLQLRRLEGLTDRRAVWRNAIVLWLILGAVAWYVTARMGPHHRVMQIPALAYTLLLATTVGVTCGLAGQNRRYLPMAFGAVLFLVSDLLLALWIFHDVVYRPFDLVWLSYGVGQMLIVYGSAWAMRSLDPSVERPGDV